MGGAFTKFKLYKLVSSKNKSSCCVYFFGFAFDQISLKFYTRLFFRFSDFSFVVLVVFFLDCA